MCLSKKNFDGTKSNEYGQVLKCTFSDSLTFVDVSFFDKFVENSQILDEGFNNFFSNLKFLH